MCAPFLSRSSGHYRASGPAAEPTSAGWIVPQQHQRVGYKVDWILTQRTRDRMGGVQDLDPGSGMVQAGQAERLRAGTAVQQEKNGVTSDPPASLVYFVGCLAPDQH